MNYINEKNKTQYVDITEPEKIKNGQFYTVISLFSGAGGLDIGLEQAGFHTIACIENDINCRATLKFNRPDWNVFEESVKIESGKIITREPGDIRDIAVDEILNHVGLKKGQVTLVVGGAPCQPFSNMGKKEGLEDKKNGDLFQEFVRMVKGIQPEAFIFENVAGITQNKHAFVLDYMIKNFEGTGYGISHSILNSANYGVPQRRERFFLIGIKDSKNPAFPLPTHMKDIKSWETFTKDLNKIPKYIPESWVTVKDAFNRLPKNPEKREDFALMNISEKVVTRMKLIKQGENFKVLPSELRPDCWKSGKHQGNDTFGRLIADLPSVTIRTAAYNPAKGMYIHPFENRGLSTIEMAILQDFPLSWIFKHHGRGRVTLASGGKQIGNAVPPGLARAIGLSIKKQLSLKHSISVEKQVELVVVS
jgi:DNA (cytosine-5)-methyltransferase 1